MRWLRETRKRGEISGGMRIPEWKKDHGMS